MKNALSASVCWSGTRPFSIQTFTAHEKPACQIRAMTWIVTLALAAFYYWLVRRGHERTIECAPTGMLRSPLYWTAMFLVCVLLALAFSERYVLTQGSVLIWMWWVAVAATVIALFVLRRALKWRYPI
jgi:hypothetical protein